MIFGYTLGMKIPSTHPKHGTLGVVDRELDVERLGTTSSNLQTNSWTREKQMQMHLAHPEASKWITPNGGLLERLEGSLNETNSLQTILTNVETGMFHAKVINNVSQISKQTAKNG